MLGLEKAFPDIAIEVVLSHSLVDKLSIYQGLGVREVWIWEAEQFRIYCLQTDFYEQADGSELLPECEIELLASYVKPDDQLDAVMDFRDVLRSR